MPTNEPERGMLSHSPSAERNKEVIAAVLVDVFAEARTILEIASGTGQHAEHIAPHLPQAQWQPTDLADKLAGLRQRIRSAAISNLRPPVELDVGLLPWRVPPTDAIFAANCLHIMSWELVTAFFAGAGDALTPGGHLAVYGPFKYAGEFTTPSNAEFDTMLRSGDPASGIRDFEAVNELARPRGLKLLEDRPMPANNQMLVWRKV